jgi:hypothetical protein
MQTTAVFPLRARGIVVSSLVVLLLALAPESLCGQTPEKGDPVLPPLLDLGLNSDSASTATANRPHRIRLFCMMPGFLSDPVGLEDPSDALPGTGATPPAPADPDSGPDWLQVAMGTDNPYFDLRRPGSPGGLGYYRVNTQLQLVDTPSTGCALGFQAYTPAGLQYGGVDQGPTVVSPAFSVFHALDTGTAMQGFVGKNMNLSPGWTSGLHHRLEYGMALQQPLSKTERGDTGNVYVFVEALGQYRYQNLVTGPPAVWQVLPGMHWRMADNLWMSSGVLLPVGTTTRPDNLQWQFTCSLQF